MACGDLAGLAPAEALFALDLEDRGHRHAGALDQRPVRIGELHLHPLRQRAPDGGLAGAHHADEEDVAAAHGDRVSRRPARLTKKSPGGTGAGGWGASLSGS